MRTNGNGDLVKDVLFCVHTLLKSKEKHKFILLVIPSPLRPCLAQSLETTFLLVNYLPICSEFVLYYFFNVFLTSSHRMPYVPANILPIDNQRTFKHAFRFLRVWPGDFYPRPVPLTYQPRNCKDGFISIVTRPLISLRYEERRL